MRTIWVRCMAAAALLLASPAQASWSSQPALAPTDPLVPGPHPVTSIEYDAQFGTTPQPGLAGAPRPDRLRGVIHLPGAAARGPRPVVVFVHGAHEACRVAGSRDVAVHSIAVVCPGPSGVAEESPSWRGYDYMGTLLAGHGYVVVSIDLNWTMALKPGNDIPDRGELVLATLGLLREWHLGARPVPDGVGALLKGRVDLDRLGLVGHSRGADAIGYVLRQQQAAPAAERYTGLRALVQVAAVDADLAYLNRAPAGVHLATVLGSCDADTGVAGAALWDRGRLVDAARPASRSLFELMGANHAFFNSEWGDEWHAPPTNVLPLNGPVPNEACSSQEPTSIRLTPADQQRLASTIITSFLRRHVGGEIELDAIATGAAGVPPTACPRERWGRGRPLPCADVLRTSYLAPASARRLLLATDAAGGGDAAVTISGAAAAGVCDPEGGRT
jgi:hypothetical protein